MIIESHRLPQYNKKVKSQYSAPSAGYCDLFFQNRPQAQQRTKTLIIRYFIKHFSYFSCMIQIIIVFLQQIKYASL